MELFTEQVIDKKLKSDLEHCLSNKRPFSNFKNKIDYSEQRQDWFDFKQTELEKMVEQLLFNG